MKRLLTIGVLGGLVATLAPAAQATPTAIQENVRHIANVPGNTGGHAVVEGNRLYLGNYGTGFSIYDITNPRLPVKTGQYLPGPTTTDGNDPGLRADAVPDAAVLDGRHIVTLNGTNRAGSTQQTEFLDASNPADIKLLHRMRGSVGEAHNGDIVDSRRLWLPSGSGNEFFRIYDLSPVLQTPPAAPQRLAGGSLQTMWNNSPYKGREKNPSGGAPTHIHDLEVYTDYNLLLLPEQWVDQDGDEIPDPTYAKKDLVFVAASQGYPLTVGAGTSAPNSAVFIVDITDPTTPIVINKIQGRAGHRYMHEVQLLQGDPHVMFTSDEDLHNGCDAGGVYSWRLSEDLTEAVYLDTWFNGTGTPAPVCSAHVFSSNGNYVFMGSYNAGLQVIDFTNPADLKRAGQYIAEGANAWGALYHAGVVYTGDFGARGLDVYEFIPNPAGKALLKAGTAPPQLAVGGVSELVAACDTSSPANGVDGFFVAIPPEKRDGTARIAALGSSELPYDVDVWFYDAGCNLMEGELANTLTGDEKGVIPEGAAFAAVNLFAGAPQWVYATFI